MGWAGEDWAEDGTKLGMEWGKEAVVRLGCPAAATLMLPIMLAGGNTAVAVGRGRTAPGLGNPATPAIVGTSGVWNTPEK